MRNARSLQAPARRGQRSSDPPETNQDEDSSARESDPEAKSNGARDEITAAIDKIKQMDPETLASLARAFLKPAEATG